MATKRIRKGLSFPFILFLVFLVLKLTKVITWSWLWICSPLWIPFALFLIVILIIFGILKSTHKNLKIYKNTKQ